MTAAEKIERHIARQEIVDLSFRYSRACDRLDKALLEAVYWPDGTDDHGIFKGSAPDYIEWVMGFLAQWTSSHHTNSNHLIEIDGEEAAGEWRILHRTCTSEWSRTASVEQDWSAQPGPSIIGKRDQSDLVYTLAELGIR